MMLLQKYNWIILDLEIVSSVSQDMMLSKAQNTFQELSAESQTLVNFEEVRENFVGINEAFPIKNYLDM